MYKAAIIFLYLCLCACSTNQPRVWLESTESLIKKHEYQQALNQVNRSKPLNTELLQHIQQRANVYRRIQLKQLHTLFSQKQWRKADRLLLTLKSTQPWHNQFARAEKKLAQLRNKERLSLVSQQAIAQAHLLIEQSNYTLFKHRNEQTKLFWWQSSTPMLTEKNLLAEKLLALANESIKQNNLQLAKQTYEQALLLNSQLKNASIQTAILQGLAKKNADTIHQKQTRFVSQLNEAMAEENFEQILKLVATLSKPSFKNKSTKQAIKAAKALLQLNAKELNQLGDSVYRQGDISGAMILWQQAQTLMPSLPELKDKITRAQKIKYKLDTLRQSQNQ
ncbi:hypothetical protein ACU6U9_18535 [Pseudomonas sp. HK3]